jgi:hypothetical protein
MDRHLQIAPPFAALRPASKQSREVGGSEVGKKPLDIWSKAGRNGSLVTGGSSKVMISTPARGARGAFPLEDGSVCGRSTNSYPRPVQDSSKASAAAGISRSPSSTALPAVHNSLKAACHRLSGQNNNPNRKDAAACGPE